ncbi:MAG: transposase [Lachnospiraceae bacterium]
MYYFSCRKKYENPKIIRKYEKKLVKLQRQLAHKEKRSQNYYKTKKKIALCHEKITNTRKDYLHKMSHEIISETGRIWYLWRSNTAKTTRRAVRQRPYPQQSRKRSAAWQIII